MSSMDCERVRLAVMAALDGEGEPSAADWQHLAGCAECRQWHVQLQALAARLDRLPYPAGGQDLWPAMEDRLRGAAGNAGLPRGLWPIGAAVLAWRALQLFVDLPAPELHPVVPLAAVAVVFWRLAVDLLAIETSAPELEKRGI